RVLPPVLEPADLVDEGAAGLQPHRHVDHLVGDGLELADRLPELLAGACVLDAASGLPPLGAAAPGRVRPALPSPRAVEAPPPRAPRPPAGSRPGACSPRATAPPWGPSALRAWGSTAPRGSRARRAAR